MFSFKIYLLIFKSEQNKYFEILLEFQDESEGRKKTLDYLESLDINRYIREKQLKLDSKLEKILNIFGCEFKVINKTLKFHKKKQEIGNSVNPNTNNNAQQLLNINTSVVSTVFKTQLKKKMAFANGAQTPLINAQFNNNNNNQFMNNNQLNNIQFMNNNQLNGNNQFNNNNQFINNNQINANNQFNNNNPFMNNNPLNVNYQFNNNNNQVMNNNQLNATNQFNNNIKFVNQMPPFNFWQQNTIMQNFQSQGNMFQNNIVGNALNNTQKKSKFPQHRTGIQNIGQTCYMNATLQALSNIVELSKPLLKKFEQKSFDIENQILAAAYSSLLYELFYPKDNQKYISPNTFKEIIGELNPLFKGMHAADAKDLIFFIIERMNKELNPIKETPNPQINFEEQEKLSLNENVMLQSFLNDFRATNNTIITNIFYGVTRSIMKCLECKTTKYSFQTFNLLIFQLKKIKEMLPKKEKIGLSDAFEVEKREEILDGDNMIYCNTCHSLKKGMHQQKIYSLPPVLIIVLNRGRNNKDFNEQFEIPLLVDFSLEDITISKESYREYYLCGIITHLGESGVGGHFIAYSRDGPYSQFYCYNDAMVSPVKNEDVLQTIISEKEYEKKTPYILLYHHYTN